MSANPFQRRAVLWIVTVSTASLLAGLVFVIFGGELANVDSNRADAYSRSAIGHHAFVELLRRLDVPVLVSRFESNARAGEGAVLVIAEPRLGSVDDPEEAIGRTIRYRLGPTLLVLPKRNGLPSLQNPAWVEDTGLVSTSEVERVLELAGVSRGVVRLSRTPVGADWIVRDDRLVGRPSLSEPQLIAHGIGAPNAQWRPLVSNAYGVLVAETRTAYNAPVVILSDPDILATHGLDDGQNAALAASIVEYLRDGSAAVVVDETVHGHRSRPTIWRQLFTFPLVLAVAHGAVLLAFVLWLATRRFGAAVSPPPAIAPGKTFLIENTAELLRYGGHSGHALRRYWFNVLQDVGQTINAPAQLDTRELRRYLTEVAEGRGVRPPVGRIAADVNALSNAVGERHARAVVRTARQIHGWRREMIDGSGPHPSA